MTGKRAGDGAGRPAPSTLPLEDQLPHAHEAALRLLSVRERSRHELHQRLRQKGYHRSVIDRVLDRLEDAGLQDDARFAETFGSQAAARGLAGRRVGVELMRRGVDRKLAMEAATAPPEEEERRARALVARRAAGMATLAPEVRRRRLEGFLARRGYPAELCRRLAAEASGAEGEDD